MATSSPARPVPGLFRTRRGRVILENLTAYTFLFPAGLIIFLFGIFPVAFALYVSLHRWRRLPERYTGIDNYVRALDDLAYVFFFWLAAAALIYALVLLVQFWKSTRGQSRSLALLLPGIANGIAILLVVRWFFTALPVVLDIPQRLLGQERVPGIFISELVASFQMPEVVAAANLALLMTVAGAALSYLLSRWLRVGEAGASLMRPTIATLLAGLGIIGLEFVTRSVSLAVAEAQAAGESMPLWTQILLISVGAALLVAAYALWTRAAREHDDRVFVLKVLATVALIAGGYLLVAELPRALDNADRNMLQSYSVTVMFVIGTVPFQLAIGLGLAYLLFQNIKGKAFFRMVYFLPYITPFVATSVVFKILFSHRPTSLANVILTSLGLSPQNWLLEPRGIFTLIFGPQLPDILAGPSLALVVIMLYTVWTYIGYDTVIFLAGLVNIPGELYEAARIDGASGWQLFRHITLPLLSPTTYFLSLIAIIGTFQAFTQIWVMRTPGSARSVDTVSVYIYETVRTTDPNMGYGSAMAFVLFVIILLLTFFQNRISESRVFYG
ncbi:MAG: sugar ABC transporter permease [Chloroflexota bacterium]